MTYTFNRRIGHFIETLKPGGAEQVLLDLCLQSKKNGDHPIILHFNHPFYVQRSADLGIEQIAIPENIQRAFKSTKTLPIFALKFRHFLKEQQIDILHSHLFGPVTGGALACFKLIPHVGTLHDIYMIEEKPIRIHLIQLAARLNTRLVTVSKNMEAFYRSKAKLDKQQIRTIYNGITPSAQADYAEKALHELRNELEISQEQITIIATGRLVKLKRLDTLIQAIRLLPDENIRRLKVLIVGEGPEGSILEKLVKSLKLESTILFTGYRRDVQYLLHISDIFVQCSQSEGLSCSILEAIAAPLPSIVTDVGGNSELVVEGFNGHLIPVGDAQKLASKLLLLINKASLRSAYAANALLICHENFLKEPNYLKYNFLYNELTTH